MPIVDRSMGDQLSEEFRQRMYNFYVYTEYAKGAVVSEPLKYSRRSNMLTMQRAILKEMRKAEEHALTFAHKDVPRAYRQGWTAAYGGKEVNYSQAALRELLGEQSASDRYRGIVGNVERDIAKAFATTRQETVRIVRDWRVLAEDIQGGKSEAGTRQRFQRAVKRIRDDKISPFTYPGGYKIVRVREQLEGDFQRGKKPVLVEKEVPFDKRYRFDTYMNLIGKHHTQVAFNRGFLAALDKQEVKSVRVSDGPDCGLKTHDDPFKVNGRVISLNDARAYTTSHPNCVRSFDPVTDVPPTPDIEDKAKSRVRTNSISQAYRDYAAIYGRVAQANARQFAVSTAEDTARGLMQDMTNDYLARNDSFNKLIQANPRLRALDARINTIADDFSRMLGRPVSKAEVNGNIERWLDKAFEDPEAIRKMPPHVQRALGVKLQEMVDAQGIVMKKAVGDVYQRGMTFGDYKELLERASMTHHQLNVTNSIESSYAERFYKNVASTFFDKDMGYDRLSNVVSRYAFNSDLAKKRNEILNREAANLLRRERQNVYLKYLKTPVDRKLDELLPIPDGAGKVRMIRTSATKFDVRHLGLRYEWDKRFLKVQTGNVNRLSFLSNEELRSLALGKGIDVREVVMRAPRTASGFGRWIRSSRYRSRMDVLDEVGYNLGLLTRVTLKPHELVRLGFRWDPATGWRRPLPNLSISSPRVGPLTLRYTARLNRGFSIDNKIRMASKEVRRAEANRALAGQGSLINGIRLRTISQEVNIALGGILDLNKYYNVGKFVLPGITNVGVRATTFVGRMETMTDFKQYVAQVGAKGFIQDTQVLTYFMEWKALGWSVLRIARVLSVHPEDIASVYQLLGKLKKNWRSEIAMTTLMSRAWVATKTPGANVDAMARYISEYEAALKRQQLTDIEKAARLKRYKQLLQERMNPE